MADLLINRVAQSGLITLDLEDYLPGDPLVHFDLKDYLFQGLILREKDFREALKQYPWEDLTDKLLLVYNSSDAIVPMWAYMLVAVHAAPYARDVFQGQPDIFYDLWYKQVAERLDTGIFAGQRVVIKGCGSGKVPASAYAYFAFRLRSVCKSIMFGEPCSTVPIFKTAKSAEA